MLHEALLKGLKNNWLNDWEILMRSFPLRVKELGKNVVTMVRQGGRGQVYPELQMFIFTSSTIQLKTRGLFGDTDKLARF